MSLARAETVVLGIHYQNENCHPDGKVRLGMAEDAEAWRARTLAAAQRLYAGARRHDVPIVHVRLAVRPDYLDVEPNAPLYRQFAELGAWQEDTWGTEFIDGLGPLGGELVVTHRRNNGFFGSALQESLDRFRPAHLVLAGVSTAYAVESTARHAADVGYRLTIAEDACQTATRTQHEASLAALSRLAEIDTVDAIVRRLAGRA